MLVHASAQGSGLLSKRLWIPNFSVHHNNKVCWNANHNGSEGPRNLGEPQILNLIGNALLVVF